MKRGSGWIVSGILAMGLLFLCTFCGIASAEISTNLQRKEIKGKKSHRVEEVWFEDQDGNRCFADDLGYAYATYKYNQKPRCILEQYFDLEGNLCVTRDGYAIVKQKWDHNGRLLTRDYYDAQENPVLGPEGYYQKKNVYDHLKLAKLVYYGTDGEYLRSDKLCAVTQYSYDEVRHLTGIECLNADLQPMNNAEGYAKLVRTYRSNELKSEYFYDASGKMVYNEERGYAGFLRTYAPTGGRVEKLEYFGADGNLMMYKGQYASLSYKYSTKSKRNPEELYFLDTEGNPATQRGGYAGIRYTYDGRGRATSMIFLDANREKIITSLGYAEIRRLYTTKNKIWYESYHDLNGSPMVVESKGYAKVERTIGSSGNTLSEYYYDEVGDRITVADGYCGVRYLWEDGKKTEDQYLSESGKLTNNVKGYARVVYTYDGSGRNTAQEYLDKEGNSVDSEHGYARCEMSYLSDRPSSYRYYHRDGTPGEGPEGVFETRVSYQVDGEAEEVTCYNAQGERTLSAEGWFRKLNLYDDDGRNNGVVYSNVQDTMTATTLGYAMLVYQFTEHGQVSVASYFGENGQYTISDKGYAKIEYEYDEDGQRISQMYYGPDEGRILVSGTAGYRMTYEDGKLKTRTTIGLDGKPAAASDTYPTSEYAYGEDGRISAVRYLDAAGQPMQSKKAVYGTRYKRNKDGKVTREGYMDAAGAPMACKDGYAARDLTYDEEGRVSEEIYLDTKGKKTTAANGSGGRTITYLDDGNIDTVTYLDTKGAPAEIGRGYARIVMIYENGTLVARRYVNLNGETILERSVQSDDA